MSEIKIRDLYTGKPDAKDEINFEGLEEFIKTFVVADHFQLDSLLYGNNCLNSLISNKAPGSTEIDDKNRLDIACNSSRLASVNSSLKKINDVQVIESSSFNLLSK